MAVKGRVRWAAAVAAAASLAAGAWAQRAAGAEGVVTGELRKWHNVTITFDGPETGEDAAPNPFADYRLIVTFRQGDRKVDVCGYYAADGGAAETGAAKGNKWRAHFAPDSIGEWTYAASFRTGPNVAVESDPQAGRPVAFDGAAGKLRIGPSDKTGRDFRAKGLLRYVGRHYLRFAESGEYFIKGGADSPENLLGYADFDGTFRMDGGARKGEASADRLHHYAPHVKDWRPGDPTWRGGKGKGIIGAMNYLASTGMNSVYFIPYNIDGGDGKDTWPWSDPKERLRFDCSKLDQWEIVFAHMDALGLSMHIITQETENDQGLNGGELGLERKLYYRELIARFGHHLAVVWNLGEENTNTDDQRKAFCQYIRGLDPYGHPIVCHTFPGQWDKVYEPLLGYRHFEGLSIQTNANVEIIHDLTRTWVARSARAGRRWFICIDEPGSAQEGVSPDGPGNNHDRMRKGALWGNLMAGGAGVEWYFGYRFPHNDLNCEDWRSREGLWAMTRHALEFFHAHLPFWAMRPAGSLTSPADDYCFALPGEVYAIYLPKAQPTELELPEGMYVVKWFNPRTGGHLRDGSVGMVRGPGRQSIGEPPGEKDLDWVALVRRPDQRDFDREADPPAFDEKDVAAAVAAAPSPRGKAAAGQAKAPATGQAPAIAALALIDVGTGRPVEGFDPLADGATIDLGKLAGRMLTVVARTAGDVEEVAFTLDGKQGKTEKIAPYSIAGDSNGKFNPWSPPPGEHTVKAVARGSGAAAELTVRFRVIGGAD